jgi:hypothetical protein
MSEAVLEAYLMQVRKKRDKLPLPINSFDGKSNLQAIIADQLNSRSGNLRTVNLNRKCFIVKEVSNTSPYVSAKIAYGEFGKMETLIDTTTGKEAYSRRKQDAAPINYHLDMIIPDKHNAGIIVLQRIGGQSIKGLFDDMVVAAFNKDYSGYILELDPVMPQEVAKEHLSKGIVKELRFIRHSLTADVADTVSGKHQADEGTVELVIKPKGKSLIDKSKLQELFTGTKDISALYSISNFEYDDIKTVIQVGDKKKTLRMSQLGSTRCYFDLSDEVKEGPDGYPDAVELASKGRELLDGLAKKAGILK